MPDWFPYTLDDVVAYTVIVAVTIVGILCAIGGMADDFGEAELDSSKQDH